MDTYAKAATVGFLNCKLRDGFTNLKLKQNNYVLHVLLCLGAEIGSEKLSTHHNFPWLFTFIGKPEKRLIST